MDANQWLTIIIAVIAASPGIFALIRQFRKDKSEIRVADSDAVSKYAEAANKTGEYIITLLKRIETSEAERAKDKIEAQKNIDILQHEINVIKQEVAEKNAYLDEWASGITKLIDQIKRSGALPCWQPRPRPVAREKI
jgi:hypothetical protein